MVFFFLLFFFFFFLINRQKCCSVSVTKTRYRLKWLNLITGRERKGTRVELEKEYKIKRDFYAPSFNIVSLK